MDSTDVRLSGPADSETVEYRAISRLSIVALILGLMSSLALLTPALWFVPIAGLGTSGLALRSLAKEPELIGRKAARIGLALAVLFGVWAPVKLFTLRGLHVAQSREVARQWLNFLQAGEFYQAHQITLAPHRRLRADMTLDEFYGSRIEWRERLGRFLARDDVRRIVDTKDGTIRYLDTLNARGGRRIGLGEHRFELIPATGKKVVFRISVQRTRDRQTGDIEWQVVKMDDNPFEST